MNESQRETMLMLSNKEQQKPPKKPITKETSEWEPNLDVALPINGSELPNVKACINWNGFHLNRETTEGHYGFDFAAYLTTEGHFWTSSGN